MRLTFDTNVLVYAADVDAGERHAWAADLVERATRVDGVLTLQCLSEFFSVMTRRGKVPPKTAAELVGRLTAVFPVVSANEHCLIQAIGAVCSHRMAFWDAMLWAASREAGCRYLLSEDLQNGRTLEGVTFVNPFLSANQALIDKLLPGG